MPARNSIHPASAATSAFVDSLSTLPSDYVAAHSGSSRRVMGRSAEALEQLKINATQEGYRDGYDAGFEQGRIDGAQQVHMEYDDSIRQFTEALVSKSEQAVFAIREWTDGSENRLAQLAVLIAGRILAQEIQLPHDTITQLTREAIAEVRHADEIRIRVNPFDAPIVQSKRNELLAVSSQIRQIEIVEDPSILGGCTIESDAGTIDAMIRTKLDVTLESFKEAA